MLGGDLRYRGLKGSRPTLPRCHYAAFRASAVRRRTAARTFGDHFVPPDLVGPPRAPGLHEIFGSGGPRFRSRGKKSPISFPPLPGTSRFPLNERPYGTVP